MTGPHPICDGLLEYVTGEIGDEEREAFERHLPDCEDCRREIETLTAAWEALPFDMERIKPPRDLKRQVFAALDVLEGKPAPGMRRFAGARRAWMASAAVLAAAFVLVAGGLLWGNVADWFRREAATFPPNPPAAVPVSEMEWSMPLQPAEGAGDHGYGIACVVRQGGSKQFVVYVFGARRTIGKEAYQVWLVSGSERRSAGTFRVSDERGVGVLAVPLRAADPISFDAIGITLEPDADGFQPRGPRVFAGGAPPPG